VGRNYTHSPCEDLYGEVSHMRQTSPLGSLIRKIQNLLGCHSKYVWDKTDDAQQSAGDAAPDPESG
jgi:hypothetical protein